MVDDGDEEIDGGGAGSDHGSGGLWWRRVVGGGGAGGGGDGGRGSGIMIVQRWEWSRTVNDVEVSGGGLHIMSRAPEFDWHEVGVPRTAWLVGGDRVCNKAQLACGEDGSAGLRKPQNKVPGQFHLEKLSVSFSNSAYAKQFAARKGLGYGSFAFLVTQTNKIWEIFDTVTARGGVEA